MVQLSLSRLTSGMLIFLNSIFLHIFLCLISLILCMKSFVVVFFLLLKENRRFSVDKQTI